MRLFATLTGDLMHELSIGKHSVAKLALSFDEELLAVAAADGLVGVFSFGEIIRKSQKPT